MSTAASLRRPAITVIALQVCVTTHIYVVGIDVVRVGVSIQQLQPDPGVVVCGVR